MGSTKAIPFEGVAYIFFDASKGGTPKKVSFPFQTFSFPSFYQQRYFIISTFSLILHSISLNMGQNAPHQL